jgi:hypothetical protein
VAPPLVVKVGQLRRAARAADAEVDALRREIGDRGDHFGAADARS